MSTVADVPSALLTGLAAGIAALMSALPGIIAAILILVIGWLITAALAGVLERALRAAHTDSIAQRAGVGAALRRAQITADVPSIAAGVLKWYLRLVVVLLATDAVGLRAINAIVSEALAFVPNVIVAVLILAAFSWLASRVRGLVTSSLEPAMPNARTIGVLAYVATFGFGIIAAATQIGIATTLIDIMFAGIVAGLALAFGLAFGLGGREEAAQVWRSLRRMPAASPAGNGEPRTRPDVVRA